MTEHNTPTTPEVIALGGFPIQRTTTAALIPVMQEKMQAQQLTLFFANTNFIVKCQAHKAAMCKMSTPVLTRLLLEAVQFQSPNRSGMFRPKLRYAHQGGMNPPVIVIHGNSLEHVTEAYKRFLEGRFRKAFSLEGTPLRIELKTSSNPYADKER